MMHIRELESSRQKSAPKDLPVTFFYRASDDGNDENLLILLHGLGDTHIPFSKLGTSLKLPQTAILALRAPEQIPFLEEEGFQWYTSFDGLGDLLERPNPTSALDIMTKVLLYLKDECGWASNRIHIFGFGQGGSIAVELGLKEEFASIVTVSGPLLSYPTLGKLSSTPLLVVDRPAPSDLALSASSTTAFRKGYQSVTQVKLQNTKGGMPSSREEWEPIMKFWSERLVRRPGEGLYQVL